MRVIGFYIQEESTFYVINIGLSGVSAMSEIVVKISDSSVDLKF